MALINHGHNCPCDRCNEKDYLTCRHDQGTVTDWEKGTVRCDICGEYLHDIQDLDEMDEDARRSDHKER